MIINGLDSRLTHTNKAHKKKHKRVKPPTRRQLATLRLKPSAGVTQGVYQRVLDEAVGVDPAQLTAQLDAAKASFRSVMKRLHWRVTDVGDTKSIFGVDVNRVRLTKRGLVKR